MSTVKTNNVQIGQSVTATNNGTWYQPATPDGTIRYGIGNAGATTTDVVTLSSSGLSASALIPSGSTAPTNGMFLPTTNTLAWSTNSTERLRLDSSGNLGLGVTPSGWYSNAKALELQGGSLWSSTTGNMILMENAYLNASASYIYKNTAAASYYLQSAGAHSWYTVVSGTAGATIGVWTQAMTLDASGQFYLGCTSVGSYSAAATLSKDSGTTKWSLGPTTAAPTQFYVAATGTTGVYLSSTSVTAWASASDERLKTDLKPITNAAEKVASLRAVTGRYISDEEGVSRSFLIAQDVQVVLPEAVDAEDSNKLGVRYTDTIPLLVAAIKELSAELNLLKQKVNA